MKRNQDMVLDPERVRDLSVKVYKMLLDAPNGGGPGATVRMLDKDNDGGKKLRGRAGSYDPISRAYIEALGVKFPMIPRKEPKS